MVLICGHGGRDARCGILGPVLQEEFTRVLPVAGIDVLQGPVHVDEELIEDKELIEGPPPSEPSGKSTARIGLISHIGGHKFAGNVIIYIPKAAKTATGEEHPLAGSGIWYGRVEPKHVEGIVNETIKKGNVISDHFRGGIKEGGEILRLPRLVK